MFQPDFDYLDMLKIVDARLAVDRQFEPDGTTTLIPHWMGGRYLAVSGELLRELDYDHPQIQFDGQVLVLAGITLRWVEWHDVYDTAIFERLES